MAGWIDERVSRGAALLLIVAVGGVWGMGCGEELLPPEKLDQPFSMYGVITPQLDTQSVRIYPIEQVLTTQRPDAIEGITVTSTHLESGEVRTWEGIVITEADGQYEFIFRAPFQAEYGARYRIEAERISDGARSFAEVRVPDPVAFEVVDPGAQIVSLAIRGDDMSVFKPVVEYLVQLPLDELPSLTYKISYQGQETRREDGWRVMIRLANDRVTVQSRYNLDAGTLSGTTCNTLRLRRLTLDVLVGDESWYPPGGIFDENALVQVGTMSNVENGFGFIGAGFRVRDEVRLSKETVEGACFRYFPR